MDNWQLNTPVLFLVFNRPDTTRQVFAQIRRAKPSRLYVAADGPRPDKPGEAEKVGQVRQLVQDGIDWDCEVKTLFRDTNLGCRRAVTDALDWLFTQEETGIILEDDCLPAQSFFRYCEELLEYYQHDERVMCISGDTHTLKHRGEFSYHFSQIPFIWGWATWRRAWRLNTVTLKNFTEIVANPVNLKFTHNSLADQRWSRYIKRAYTGELDTWDFLWCFANLVNSGLSIHPNVNLIENIGFGIDAAHTTNENGKSRYTMPTEEIKFPLKHPPCMIYDKDADDYFYRNYFHAVSFWELQRRNVKIKISQIFGHFVKF